MIRGLFLLIVCAFSLLPANANENLTSQLFPRSITKTFNPHLAYSSDWESVPAWQLTESQGSLLYTYSRPLEQVSAAVLSKGLVVVYAKGYDFGGISKAEEKPLGLPFYMMGANESLSTPYVWSYSPQESKITIGLSMDSALKPGFEQAQKDIKLRFFVLTPEFLRQNKLSVMAARKLTYSQLVAMLNTTP